MRSLLLAAVALPLLLPTRSAAQARQRSVVTDFVVSTEWLAGHLKEPGVVLVHVVQDSAYRGDHIPGSRKIWYREFVTTRGTVGSELPSVEQLKAVMQKHGITRESRVIVYAPEAPMATRLLFTLDYLGHDRMSFLDGGLRAWKREGRAVTNDVQLPTPSSYEPRPREQLVASAEYISERLGKPGIALIDTRTTDEYLGTGVRGGLPSVGHLAGARQLEWEQLFSDADHSVLKPRAELEQLYGERTKPGDQLVAYCWVGYRGSATYFIARHLGYDVKLYDGSYQDWAQRSLPVKAGATP